jgi:hypothetical protein
VIVEEQGSRYEEIARAAPGLARIYALAWLRTAEWAAELSAEAGARAIRAVLGADTSVEFLQGAADSAREYARRLFAVVDGEGPEPYAQDGHRGSSNGHAPAATLRDRGAELLRRSADVTYDEPTHPAYARILDDLAPDEARMLRLLATEGSQPFVDVRSGWLPINSGSGLVRPRLTMIAAEAGCRHVERSAAYLNNLQRLGLIWFSPEPVEDQARYQVLEAQPDVVGALREASRGRTVRRCIRLTPFGRDFCAMALPFGAGAGEVETEPLAVDPDGDPDPVE